jgi:hypothetical protein
MEEGKPQSVFGTSQEGLEQEIRRVRAESHGRTLTLEEYQEQMREEAREKLENELRKTPKQRAEERRAWLAKTSEDAQKARVRFLESRRPSWPSR